MAKKDLIESSCGFEKVFIIKSLANFGWCLITKNFEIIMSKGFVIGPLKERSADGSTAWLKIFDKTPSSCTVADCAEEEFVENREGVRDESLLLD